MPDPVPVISNIVYGKDADGNQIVDWDETTTVITVNHKTQFVKDIQTEVATDTTLLNQKQGILQAVPAQAQPVGP